MKKSCKFTKINFAIVQILFCFFIDKYQFVKNERLFCLECLPMCDGGPGW